MATDLSSVPYLGTLRVMLIPRNATGRALSHNKKYISFLAYDTLHSPLHSLKKCTIKIIFNEANSSNPIIISFPMKKDASFYENYYLKTLQWTVSSGNQVNTSAEPRIIWSLTNQQEPRWTYAQVSFVPDAPYLLTFEGIRASDVRGVIGIDDVTLFSSSCTIKPTKAEVASGDCSFEFDTCGWKPINPGSALDLRPQDWKLADRNQGWNCNL